MREAEEEERAQQKRLAENNRPQPESKEPQS
jgi:hypothetical protein